MNIMKGPTTIVYRSEKEGCDFLGVFQIVERIEIK